MLVAGDRLGPSMLIVFFGVLAVFLHKKQELLGVPPLLLLGFVHPLAGAVLACFFILMSKRTTRLVFAFSLLACIVCLVFGFVVASSPMPNYDLFGDLGLSPGLSIFMVIAAIIGLFVSWPLLNRGMHLFTILLFLLVILDRSLFPLALLGLASAAGLGINVILRRRWSWPLLRDSCVLLIACGIVFTGVSHSASVVKAEPSLAFSEALSGVRQFPDGVIVSDPSMAHFAEYFSGKPSVFSGASKSPVSSYAEFVRSPRYEDARRYLDGLDYSYAYIVLNRDMLGGERRGLAFIVENNERFINVTTNHDVEVWLHIRP
jgi:hypothetical protein